MCFPVPVPKNFKEEEVRELLDKQGYTRFFEPRRTAGARAAAPRQRRKGRKRARAPTATVTLEVVQDRLRAGSAERGRVLESLEAALRVGRGRVNVQVVDDARPAAAPATLALLERAALRRLRPLLPRADARACSRSTRPLGACETCRGFGRTIGIDYGLVIPDETKSLRARRDQALADQVVRGMPGRPGEVCEEARHPARHARGAS